MRLYVLIAFQSWSKSHGDDVTHKPHSGTASLQCAIGPRLSERRRQQGEAVVGRAASDGWIENKRGNEDRVKQT